MEDRTHMPCGRDALEGRVTKFRLKLLKFLLGSYYLSTRGILFPQFANPTPRSLLKLPSSSTVLQSQQPSYFSLSQITTPTFPPQLLHPVTLEQQTIRNYGQEEGPSWHQVAAQRGIRTAGPPIGATDDSRPVPAFVPTRFRPHPLEQFRPFPYSGQQRSPIPVRYLYSRHPTSPTWAAYQAGITGHHINEHPYHGAPRHGT